MHGSGDVTVIKRPERWDAPFDPNFTDADVTRLLTLPEFAAIDGARFPKHIPLAGVLKNDTRLVRYQPGDIAIRAGDYGNSAFFVLKGTLRVVLARDLPVRDSAGPVRRTLFGTLTQGWRRPPAPEIRDISRYENLAAQLSKADHTPRIILQDVPAVLEAHDTTTLTRGALFGELSALGRMPRTATIFADEDAELLEIRWQGLRELRRFDAGWRSALDARSRENAQEFLRALPLFRELEQSALENLAAAAHFETHGDFDWHTSFQRMREIGKADPLIAGQGHYPDGLLILRAGFARLSRQVGSISQTQCYLGAGSMFGLDEIWDGRTGDAVPLRASLHALGFVDLLRLPTRALEKSLFPHLREKPTAPPAANRASAPAMEWCIDERFVNGRRTMVIDLDRCVRCDDCVSACAAAHEGNPRFVRHGRVFDRWMVANACMHCADPVCMIGCPTGAIHRSQGSGTIVINDDTCIGCGTCATACPYDNIRMVDVRDLDGRLVRDKHLQMPIRKATKCDYCEGRAAGPACVNACPHDALRRVDLTHETDFETR